MDDEIASEEEKPTSFTWVFALIVLAAAALGFYKEQISEKSPHSTLGHPYKELANIDKSKPESMYQSWASDKNFGNRQRGSGLLQIEDEEIRF